MDEFAHAKSQLWVTRLNCYIEHLVVKHVLRVYPNIQTDSEISSLLHILSIYLNIPYLFEIFSFCLVLGGFLMPKMLQKR